MGLRKSTVKQIKERFDNDVKRFSSLDIGQTTTVDAVLAMDLVTQAAALTTPMARARPEGRRSSRLSYKDLPDYQRLLEMGYADAEIPQGIPQVSRISRTYHPTTF